MKGSENGKVIEAGDSAKSVLVHNVARIGDEDDWMPPVDKGDPLTKDPKREREWGTGGPGHTVKAEFNDRSHQRGVLSMARSSDPDSAGSQFYITYGPTPHLDNNYTVFGRVTSGMEHVDRIKQGDRMKTVVINEA